MVSLTRHGDNSKHPKRLITGCLLGNWNKFRLIDEVKKKKKFIFYYNNVKVQYELANQQIWPRYGSSHYNDVVQLDLFCKTEIKWEKSCLCAGFL